MERKYRYVHLHGFASSPLSRKGVFLSERFKRAGVELELPDLNRPSFATLTYSDALSAINGEDGPRANGETRIRLSGSSMGGYLAARWAERHPDRVDRLVLLCPGFDMMNRWKTILGREVLEQWEREGTLELPDAEGRMVPVHFGLVEDMRKQPPWPEVPCPTLILHGLKDEIVPIESSRRYARELPGKVKLVELEDDHTLAASMERIAEEITRFFEMAL
jgi:pimeloyl-ACP methyl ester carboxylesterase